MYVTLKIVAATLIIYIITCVVGIFTSSMNREYIKDRMSDRIADIVVSFINSELTVYGGDFDGKRVVNAKVVAKACDNAAEKSVIDGCFASNYACISEYDLYELNGRTYIADTLADEIINGEYEETPVINDSETQSVLQNYTAPTAILEKNVNIINTLLNSKDNSFLLNNFYIVDSTTSVTEDMLNIDNMLAKDMKLKNDNSAPQILIYHTHASENYSDSREGVEEDTIVGVGEKLTQILSEEYGYNVIHNKTSYDIINGNWNRQSYDTALPSLKQYLSDNPTIEVMIDLHRNSGSTKAVTDINGFATAQVMLFNGTTRSATGYRDSIPNDNLKANLAFSLQLEISGMKNYPDFVKKIYLKGYRYNLHLSEKSILIEVGNDKNTVSEAKNAMIPLAKILNDVIGKQE